MMTLPAFALVADTLLVRPVDIPAPWYSVATGVLSIVVTLLLLGIAVALFGMGRALKAAEHRFGHRLEGLSTELIPLAKTLNSLAMQLAEVTTSARSDLRKLSGTISAVDDAVRDALDAGEARLERLGTLVDVVQEEAEATVASATGVVRGVRTGARSLVTSLFDRRPKSSARASSRSRTRRDETRDELEESDIRARLAALEAAFSEIEEDEDEDGVAPPATARRGQASRTQDAAEDAGAFDAWAGEEEEEEEDDDDIDYGDDDDKGPDDDEIDDEDDDLDEDDVDEDDDDLDDDDDEIDEDSADAERASDVADDPRGRGAAEGAPRSGGPRIRQRRRA